jgi:hypothetical protein
LTVIETIPFSWWNTKLAPPSVTVERDETHREQVAAVVSRRISDAGCRLFGLAEVRREDPLGLVPTNRRGEWSAVRDHSGLRHDFDVALLFHEGTFTLHDHEWVTAPAAGERVRAGLVAVLSIGIDQGKLIVGIAHWRSDARDSNDARGRRTRAAEAFRNRLAAMSARCGQETPILVAGDFNAEPYDDVLAASLATARYREVVQEHRPRQPEDLLLYNAAWRWLGERHPWDGVSPPSLAGTYHTGKRRPGSWRTFDHVLVSRSLLGTSGWTLMEQTLGAWPHELVFDAEKSRPRKPFDHLPLCGELHWRP